jgi:hypothetical protein
MTQGLTRRLLREPLVHFAGLSLLIFLAYWAIGPRTAATEELITVTPARIEQLSAVFSRTWQRPPTPAELKGLIDDFVKEEIYVREARKLGLAEDDTVIRRRLRMKMEFLSDMDPALSPPADSELQSYLDTHASAFAEPPRYSFEQIYLSTDKRGASADADAVALREALRGASPPNPAAVGDTTLLPPALSDVSADVIARDFGEAFAAALQGLPVGTWEGPVRSPYGLHLVRVSQRQDGRQPKLSEIRDQVLREWTEARRAELERQRMDELLKRYSITIMPPGTSP